MSRYFLATILATCACAQPVTVGLTYGNGWVPAGTYESGKWKASDRKRPPTIGALWGEKFEGRLVHVVLPNDDEYHEIPWQTDAPQPPVGEHPTPFGVVISPPTPVIVFRDVSAKAPEQQKVQEFVAPTMKAHLDSRIATEQLHSAKVIGSNPPTIKRGKAAIDGQVYYHVLYLRVVRDQDCEGRVFTFNAWFTEAQSGVRNLASAHSQLSCDGSPSTYVNPMGAFVLNGAAYAVAEETYYEGASAVIMSLSPQGVRVLLRNHWTQD